MTDSGGIFISYRREDTAAVAGRLADLLVDRFGEPQVFMDVDTIDYGQDFVQRIERALAGCDVLLAPIGRKWLTATDGRGNRRIADPDDYVATEIATALERGVTVIPILVDGARMVAASDLPVRLSGLARRNATTVDRESFAADADRVLDAVQRIVDTADLRRSGRPRRRSDREPGATPDSVDDIAEVLMARNRRRTRRWWGIFGLAVLLAQMSVSVVVSPPAPERLGSAWLAPAVVLGGLAWCAVSLRREIAAQRLLVGQLPTIDRIERVRRATSPRRVRIVAVICLVVSLVVGTGVALSPQDAGAGADRSTGADR